MGFWDWFKPKPPIQPPTQPQPEPVKYCRVSVFAADGSGLAPVTGGTLRFDDPSWPILEAVLEGGRLKFTLPKPAVYGWQVHLTATTEAQDGRWDVILAPDIDVALPSSEPAHAPRRGIVRLSGQSWQDDGGPYYPLGDTLLYALGHWHRGGAKRELVKENLAFLASYSHDYIRILGQVDWAGEEIDPNWPTYDQDLGDLIDCAYDTYGLRTKVTVIGGGAPNPKACAEPVRRVIAAGRQQKAQLLEAVNEQNGSGADAVTIARVLGGLGVPVATGRGNAGISTIKDEGDLAHTSVDCFHTERGLGSTDEPGGAHARQVRQCWDFHHFNRASENGEPPGPASSVATLTDPYQLATFRAASIICGAGAFCLHTGSGVYGRDYLSSAGMRYARLADIPNIDAIMTAVRNADLRLPSGIENWPAFNVGHPVNHIQGEANKLFGCRHDRSFVEVLIGCDGIQTFQATVAVDVAVYHIATGGMVGEHHLSAGQTFQQAGLWAYLLVGETR